METYSTKSALLASDVDLYGRWRPGSIFVAMQESAITHADLLGCGRDPMLKKGMFWAVFRTQLQMQKYPLMGDEVVLTTWPGKTNRGFFPRYHTFQTPDGVPLGAASSLWVIVDVDSRSMILFPDLPSPMPDTSQLTPPLPFPSRAETLHVNTQDHRITPCYTDLDVNQHVNNTRYVDWVCDRLPLSVLSTHAIDDIVLNYIKEIRPDQSLALRTAHSEDQFSMIAGDADQGQVYFEASLHLTPWKQETFFL